MTVIHLNLRFNALEPTFWALPYVLWHTREAIEHGVKANTKFVYKNACSDGRDRKRNTSLVVRHTKVAPMGA